MRNAFAALFRSRKFLLAVFGVVQSAVSVYLEVPVELWASIDALVVVVISGIAVEDAAEKRAGDTSSKDQVVG